MNFYGMMLFALLLLGTLVAVGCDNKYVEQARDAVGKIEVKPTPDDPLEEGDS